MEKKHIENFIFDRLITDIIRDRKSVRTYKEERLLEDVEMKLKVFISNLTTPLGTRISYDLIHTENLGKNGKIGTYGIIKGSNTYVVAIVPEKGKELLDLGYTFEEIILYATSLGLGTCWLGGTFNRGKLATLVGLKEGDFIPAISPIGYPTDKKRLIETAMRSLASSNKRKDWKELFFKGTFEEIYPYQDNDPFSIALEMVRVAPSASNKQPWRIIKNDRGWHFYLKEDSKYKALGFNIQLIDMGIAMCHFELSLKERDITGRWFEVGENYMEKNSDLQYMISWKEE
ncbi:nitroreductase family protein [Alkaliphilus serpentinus]|uniref:Nitroreductase n=1 Tax=Alkaliphilus serpentinus TaxID=1482731 RepID=A0A833MAT7_9FIRM|nr:nitroreductase family protein [Alkaliphilus serpentinus]KAB3531548.1 nitroreductase [Alkaliphilus serpentinus]